MSRIREGRDTHAAMAAELWLAEWRRRLAIVIVAIELAIIGAALALLGFVLVAAAAAAIEYPALQAQRRNAIESGDVIGQVGFGFQMAMLSIWLLSPLVIYPMIYVFPVLMAMPLIAPIVGLWGNPPRILVLRPFNRGRVGGALRATIRRHVSPFGHVYTLADADIRVRWFVRFPMLLGQFGLFSFRARRIRSERSLARLLVAMRRTWLRNINWCISIGKSFPVACTDGVWKRVVADLLREADIIVVDATEMRPSLAWELRVASDARMLERMVFLVDEHEVGSDVSRLREELPEIDADECVHPVSRAGVVDARRFRDALARRARRLRDGAPRIESRRAAVRSVVAVALFSLQCVPLAALAVPVIPLELVWLPRWVTQEAARQPFDAVRLVTSGAIPTLGVAIVTLILLLYSWRDRPTIGFLVITQAVLLLISPLGLLSYLDV